MFVNVNIQITLAAPLSRRLQARQQLHLLGKEFPGIH